MPKYVTESGYEEFEEVRTRVGRNAPLPHKLWLVDVAGGKVTRTEVRRAAGHRRRSARGVAQGREARIRSRATATCASRPTATAAARRSTGATTAATSRCWCARSTTRIAGSPSVDLRQLRSCSRATACTDAAWINWGFNDFGWLPDGSTLWFLSEQSRLLASVPAADGGKRPRADFGPAGKCRRRSCRPTAAASCSCATASLARRLRGLLGAGRRRRGARS